MSSGGVVLLVVLLALGALAWATVVVVVRGGRGPADPPASHARVDPAGFPVPPAPRGALPVRPPLAVRSTGPAGSPRPGGFRLRSAPGVPMQR